MSSLTHKAHASHSGKGCPAWWPVNEPWPPADDWRPTRRVFLRKVGILLAFLALVIFVIPWLVFGALYGFSMPEAQVDSANHARIAVMSIVALVVIGAFIVHALRKTGSAVDDVMGAAELVALGNYNVQVAENGTNEVRRLVTAFNEMTTRLKENETQRRALQADIAHELRNPLSVIQGTIEAMIEGVYPVDQRHLSPLLQKTALMADLLEDLQTLSMADAGGLKLQRETVNVHDLVDGVVAEFQPEAVQRGTRMTALVDGPETIDADPVRLHQVLANLVRNALRHALECTEIAIAVSQNGSRTEFRVSDTGPGIPADELPHIFDRFTKSADTGGSGLGLAIARRLVEAHGGEIEATSTLGDGATIRFWLPHSSPS